MTQPTRRLQESIVSYPAKSGQSPAANSFMAIFECHRMLPMDRKSNISHQRWQRLLTLHRYDEILFKSLAINISGGVYTINLPHERPWLHARYYVIVGADNHKFIVNNICSTRECINRYLLWCLWVLGDFDAWPSNLKTTSSFSDGKTPQRTKSEPSTRSSVIAHIQNAMQETETQATGLVGDIQFHTCIRLPVVGGGAGKT